mmetsp:Transcript_52265/g.150513  ORF Transcript_52265/g.150513 Transcript_52265/m.150513 type:complete len:286 (+) Transcript_52265:119-976(+)
MSCQAASTFAGPPCAAFRIEGFADPRLNQLYMINPQIRIGEQPTYWDPAGDCFMYYQHIKECQCWAICLAFDSGKNLLHEVQAGSLRGLAFELFESGFETWSEYSEKEESWTTRRLSIAPAVPHAPSAAVAPPTDGTSTAAPASSAEADGDKTAVHRVPMHTKFLQENPHVEEVVLIKGTSYAKVLVRFRGARSAADAAEVGRRLLPGRREPDAIDSVPRAHFCNVRQECHLRRRPASAAPDTDEVGRLPPASGAAEQGSVATVKRSASDASLGGDALDAAKRPR